MQEQLGFNSWEDIFEPGEHHGDAPAIQKRKASEASPEASPIKKKKTPDAAVAAPPPSAAPAAAPAAGGAPPAAAPSAPAATPFKSLTVKVLKEKLEAAGLATDGLKAVLVARLQAHVDSGAAAVSVVD